MAKFANKPFLTVLVNEGTNRANIKVEGQIEFSEIDINLMKAGLVYSVRGTLMGEDSGLFGSDDTLLPLGSRSFTGVQPARVAYSLVRNDIPKSVLNEDVGEDELYGRLNLANSLSATPVAKANSQVVKGNF